MNPAFKPTGILPSTDLRSIKEDADLAARNPSEREGFRTIGVLGLLTSPDRHYDPSRITQSTVVIVKLAEQRQKQWLERSLTNPSRALDFRLATLQTTLRAEARSETGEPISMAPGKLTHEVRSNRFALRYKQEEWRDQLDAEIAGRVVAGKGVDEAAITREVFIERPKKADDDLQARVITIGHTRVLLGQLDDELDNLVYSRLIPGLAETAHEIDQAEKSGLSFDAILETSLGRLFVKQIEGIRHYPGIKNMAREIYERLTREQAEAAKDLARNQEEARIQNGLHFIAHPWDNIERLIEAIGVEVAPDILRADLLKKAQEHQFGFGFSEDLNTTLPGISAQASRNTEWDVYGLTLHFTPEAQAQIATAPLLPPLVFRKA